jgi:hypothetical protein
MGGNVGAVEDPFAAPILNAKGATYAQAADWGVAEAEGFIRLYGMSSTSVGRSESHVHAGTRMNPRL